MMTDYDAIREAINEGDAELVTAEVERLLAAGREPAAIINGGLLPGLQEMGEKFKEGEVFVPEVLLASIATNAGLDLLKPLLTDLSIFDKGPVVIGTVLGDLHDIGKNLVGMLLESEGYRVINLGTEVGPEAFVAAVKEHQPAVVGLSALLTTTMVQMPQIIAALEEAGLREQVKVIVGGAPLSSEYAAEIHADGYAPDAREAVALCNSLLAIG